MFKNIHEAEQWLQRVPMFGAIGRSAANFNLDRMVRLLSMMGNPHQKFKSVHVGGTNGKGSVSRMLASVYQTAGYKTGLYTSPHLISVWERFRINSAEADSSKLLPFFNRYGEFLEKERFTYFEITTAMAFWYFAEENVDIAIIEVGLGGRLDATNVIIPELSVITSIALDHTEILGNSIESVAFEKSGIIKENRPVVAGRLPEISEKIIRNRAVQKNAEYLNIDSISAALKNGFIELNQRYEKNKTLKFRYSGKQVDALNAAIVWLAIKKLEDKFPVKESHLTEGIESCRLKFSKTAAFEKLLPNRTWYFDGAHNEEAVHHLVQHLNTIAQPDKWTVVLSYMSDKITDRIASQWSDFSNIYLHEMQLERAASIDRMKDFFPDGRAINISETNYLHQFETELVIFSGSFYFYNEVSKWLGATDTTG